MKSDGGKNDSIWTSTADVPAYPALAENLHTNVCVIGAGIAGLTTAYIAAREGKSVVVLDDGPIAGGESGRTTAHLSNALDDRYFELEKMFGAKGARLAAESHTAAIDLIDQIVRDEKIDCDFVRLNGYLFNPPGWSIDYLHKELEAARRAGIEGVEMVDRAPLPAFNTGACLCFPEQGQFHPVRYLAGLAQAVERLGGRLFTQSFVEKVQGGDPARISVRGGFEVTANSVVVATNTPFNDWVTMHTKQAAYRTYVIGALVPKGAVPVALYWDTPDPYHYVRVTSHSDTQDVLVIGGEDHKTGQAHDLDQRFDRLESWARNLFPMIGSIHYHWSGQVMEPADSLAYIGHNPMDEQNVYIVTGDSGNGMTHGTLAGLLITDLIQGRENPWAQIYDPKRKPIHAIGEFTKENLNVAAQYVDLVTPGNLKHEEDLAPGCGAIRRRGVEKIAIYRDEAGELHELSAVCPHLGCIVGWNNTEKSWDCPCHGSRFDALGKVINGPANSDLTATEDND